jgi:site-specific recombinase XerD
MASFRLHGNGFIYLYHWIDRRTSFRISTKMKIEERDWNREKARPYNPQATFNGYTITNEMVRYEGTLNRALALQPEVNKTTLTDFKKLFVSLVSPIIGQEKKEYNFLTYFKDYQQKLQHKKQSNYKGYKTCYGYLKEYFNSSPPKFETINMKFYDGFSQFLISKNLAANTIGNQWKLIKAAMQSAFVAGLHTNEQFRHFKRKMESTDSIYLSEKELERMYEMKLDGHLAKARDYFIIGAYTGLRYVDWDRVRGDSIKDGILTVRSSKTDEISIIPVHPYVQAILDKYNGILPPKPSNQKMNDYIKVVAAYAKIEEDIETRITKGGKKVITVQKKHQLVTTHTARRSLATNLIIEGVSPFVVMKITGHKSLTSFEKYVRLRELQAMIELKSISFFN